MTEKSKLIEIMKYFSKDGKLSCSYCGSHTSELEIEKILPNIDEPLISNLVAICPYCSDKIHPRNSTIISVTKEMSFDSAHFLPDYTGACNRLHGHLFTLKLTFKGHVGNDGMVCDFKDIKKTMEDCIINKFDHRLINDFIKNPTAENILVYIWSTLVIENDLKGLYKIEIFESPTSCATLEIDGMILLFNNLLANCFPDEEKQNVDDTKISGTLDRVRDVIHYLKSKIF